MKIYLAGAMTGLPKLNSDEFARVTEILRDGGHEVYSPAEAFPHDQPFCHKTAWPEYTKVLAASDAIVLMHGWEQSLGARTEFMLAMNLKLTVYTQTETDLWLEAQDPTPLIRERRDWELAGANKVLCG